MTNEQGLNEALAELVGFKDLADKDTGIYPVLRYQLLDGNKEYCIPDFTNDLSACSKYLVPLARLFGVTKISFSYLVENVRCDLWGGFQAEERLNHALVNNGSEALALCLAIMNLPDKHEGESLQ